MVRQAHHERYLARPFLSFAGGHSPMRVYVERQLACAIIVLA